MNCINPIKYKGACQCRSQYEEGIFSSAFNRFKKMELYAGGVSHLLGFLEVLARDIGMYDDVPNVHGHVHGKLEIKLRISPRLSPYKIT